jgi:MerR family Zn(II)-responsive transcriptional regulator of zntA
MLTIGKVATAAEVSPDTLRYYEREGLLVPASKTASGYRLYDGDALRRVRFIKQAQQCGFSLSDIRELITLKSRRSACCSDVRNVAVEKKLQVEAKIKALEAMSRALDELIAQCVDEDRPLSDCPILSCLEETGMQHR